MNSSVRQKVIDLFQEMVGERAGQLNVAVPLAQRTIAQALSDDCADDIAQDIAFHLTDWNYDAAFIMAVLLFPERFTSEEIQDGVELFLVHAPNHVAAAAKLAGFPVSDQMVQRRA